MKNKKCLVLLLVFALVLAALGFLGYRTYQSQFVWIGDVRYEKDAPNLSLSGQIPENPEILLSFTALEKLYLRDTGISVQEYEQIKRLLPDTEIFWDVPFQGTAYAMETNYLTVDTLSMEDLEVLDYFEKLNTLSAENCPDYQVLHELRLRRPELEVTYRIPIAGEAHDAYAQHLELPGLNIDGLREALPYFTDLETVVLNAPLAPIEEILSLREAFPQVNFTWNLEIAGIPVNEFTETLDLTGLPVTAEEIDALIPYLPNLSYVDMTDCGISNEEMDALNQRHENVKIVWTVTLGGWYRVKTDITAFMPLKDDYYPIGDELYNLRYCHDVMAVDVGHRRINGIEWAAHMPHLKYLIIADSGISDLTPLSNLKELVYLEIFLTAVRDYSPLLTVTSLEDLNLSYTRGDPKIIAQMTWLKNVWWGYWEDIGLDYNIQQMLREAIPECNFCFVSKSSTGMGWRKLPNYYAQRDAFGMYYMSG